MASPPRPYVRQVDDEIRLAATQATIAHFARRRAELNGNVKPPRGPRHPRKEATTMAENIEVAGFSVIEGRPGRDWWAFEAAAKIDGQLVVGRGMTRQGAIDRLVEDLKLSGQFDQIDVVG